MPSGSSRRQLRRRKAVAAGRNRVRVGEPAHGATGTARRHGADVDQHAVAQRRRRNVAQHRILARLPQAFVVPEKEQPIAADGPANRAAEVVFVELGRLARQPALQLGELVEVLVARPLGVAVRPVAGTMEFVGAALGHQRHLGGARAAHVGAVVARADLELLQRVERHAHHRRVGEALHRIVDVNAVERDVRLIAARAGDRSAALIVGRQIRGAGLQAEQTHRVARLERELLNLPLGHRVAEARVGGVDNRRPGRHFDRLGDGAERQRDVHPRRGVHRELEVLAHRGAETAELDFEGVKARRQRHEPVTADVVCGRRPRRAGAGIGERDGRSGKRSALLILDVAVERRGAGLRPEESGCREHECRGERRSGSR